MTFTLPTRLRALLGRTAPAPVCSDVHVIARTPLPVGERDGDELDRWSRELVATLRSVPDVRCVARRGRGNTRRELYVTVRRPAGSDPGHYVRGLIDGLGGLHALPAAPRLEVYARAKR